MKPPFSIQDVEANPAYAKMTAEEQDDARARYFQTYILDQPEFKALDVDTQVGFAQAITERAPVLEKTDDPAVLFYTDLQNRAKAGDAEALAQLKTREFALKAGRGSLLGKAAGFTGAQLAKMIYGDTADYNYGREGRKLSRLNIAAIASSPGVTEKDLAGLDTWSAVAGTALGLVEDIAAFGKLAKAAKGVGALGKATASVEKFASGMKSGVLQRAVSSIGAATIDGVAGAAYSAVKTAVVDGLEGEWGKKSVGEIAGRFGEDIAANYAFWVGLSAVGVAAKTVRALIKSPQATRVAGEVAARDVEAMVGDLASSLMKSGELDSSLLAQLPEDLRESFKRQYASFQTARVAAKLRTPEDAGRVLAKGAGFDLAKEGDVFVVRSQEDDVIRASYSNLDDAVAYSLRNADVPSPPPGGGIAAASSHLGYKDVVTVKKTGDAKTLAALFEDTTAARADSREYVARNLFEQAGADTKGLVFKRIKNDDLFKAPGGGEYGLKGEVAAAPEAFRQKIADAAARGEVLIPDGAFKSASQEAMYLDGLRKGILARGGSDDLGKAVEDLLRPGTRGRLTGLSRSSNTALSSVAKNAYGPDARLVVDEVTGAYSVTVPSTGGASAELHGQAGRQVVLAATGENSFRLALLAELKKSGRLTDEQVAWTVGQATGMKLAKVEKAVRGAAKGAPTTTSSWSLLGADGKTVASFASTDEVLQHDELFGRMILMPDEFAPKVYVSNLAKGELTFEGALAEGPIGDLHDLRSQFAAPFTGLGAEGNRIPTKGDVPGTAEGTFEYKKGERVFVLRAYEGAAPRTFASFEALTEWAKRAQHNLDDLRYDARVRGQELLVGRDGSATLYDGQKTIRFSTRKQLQRYYREHPVAEEMPEILPGVVDPKIAAEMTEEAAKIKLNLGPEGRKVGIGGVFSRLWHGAVNPDIASRVAGPTESTLANFAKATGDTSMLSGYQNFKVAQRLVNSENRRFVRFVDEAWGKTSVTKREALGQLLSVDRDRRPQVAKELFGVDLDAQDLARLEKTEAFLNTFLKTHGYDGLADIYARKTDLQAAVTEALAKGGDLPADGAEFVREALGQSAPRSLSLFADGLTRTDLLNFFDEKDPAVAMMAIIDKVNRQRFLGPLQKTFGEIIVKAHKAVGEGKLPPSVLGYFRDTIDTAQGIRTSLAQGLDEKARKVSYALADVASKSKFLKNFGLAEEIKTDDLLGKLGILFTNNAQAFRAWAIPRNMTQIMYVGAITGNGNMWRAFQYVLDNPKYIDELYARGAMQESILSMGEEALTPLRRIQRAGLAPLEVSDGLTRATAIRAAEEAVDKALPRFAKGLSDVKGFLRETYADFLPEASKAKFLELAATDVRAAKDFLGQQMQIATMFDYSRGALGYAGRGVIGRLFGKMGTYPMYAVDLYKRILTTGSVGTRLARAARLVATSYATYYAFQAAGATYDGFLWSDPFSFSGGPYWTLMTSALNSVGNRPENKLARTQLARQSLAALVPGAMLASYAARAAKAAEEGDFVGLLRALGTVPMSQEERLRRQAL